MDSSLLNVPTTELPDEGSKFKLYSIGVAANNLQIGDSVLMVTPLEKLNLLDNEIASIPFKQTTTGEDATGEGYQTSVETDNAIECKWLGGGEGHRRTPPNIRRGEYVYIYQFADADEYYWKPMGRPADAKLRRGETVTYTFSGTLDDAADPTDPSNCYVFEVSTHLGRITLTTSKANGEKVAYAVQLNPKDGLLLIADDLGNSVAMDSTENHIELQNADDSTVSLNKKNIDIAAQEQINLKTKLINMEAKSIKIKADTIETEGNAVTMKASAMKVDGNFEVTGTSKFKGAMTASGITSDKPISGPSDTI